MRQWLMNVSLLQGWLPATLFAITAALMVILLIGAIATIRKAGLKPVLMPLVIAAVAGAVGFVITWAAFGCVHGIRRGTWPARVRVDERRLRDRGIRRHAYGYAEACKSCIGRDPRDIRVACLRSRHRSGIWRICPR